MRSASERLAPWVGILGDLLQEPLTAMPHEVILDQLHRTFSAPIVSQQWRDGQDRRGMLVSPVRASQPLAHGMEEWNSGKWDQRHPLVRWHTLTGDARPQTNDRVPSAVVSQRQRQPLLAALRPFDCEQQLTISYRMLGSTYESYVIGRGNIDFPDSDLMVAGQLQRGLRGLHAQVLLLNSLRGRPQPREAGLTGRELAVLRLVAAGEPTQVIARRLACSPRTVHKHLERVYRKLGVRDRLNAVRIARLWGLTG